MKMAGIKKATKQLVFSLVAVVTAFAGISVFAQGDIVSIKSNQSGEIITASGVDVEMRVTLNGHFELIDDGGSTTGDALLRMIVNGTVAWARLDSISRYAVSGGATPRTDVIFQYTVKPGDMASPLAVYGNAGSSSPGDAYQFIWNGWQVSQVGDPTTLAVWRYRTDVWIGGDVYDPTFKLANITLRTLAFNDAVSPVNVAATETVSWRVTSVNPIESSVVDFYVWPDDPSVAQVGSVPGQALLISMPSGSTEVDFAVRGLAAGSTDIYLQRTADYLNNGTVGVTNYIKRAITVTPPPEPTVRIVMVDNGSDNISMGESGVLSTGNFRVELSEPYGSDIDVQIDTSIAGTSQNSLTFASDPFVLRIPAGDTASPDSKFNVPDGTLLSEATGVTLRPVIQDPTSAAYYSRVREGTVYVENVNPVITRPESGDVIDVTRGVISSFEFTVADVPADRSTLITRWNFGDSTPELVITGHVGQATHTFTTTGTRMVTVQAEDKDGGVSSVVQFEVNVEPPQAQPSVTVTPSSFIYDETTANATGELTVTLSESFNEDVYIRLETVPSVQGSIVLSTTNAFRISQGVTNSVSPLRFSLVDGTEFSELTGITIRPVVTNAAAAAYYTDLKETTVFVENVDPVITSPLASDLAQPADSTYGYNQIPLGEAFTFNYDVADVTADRASMQVEWNFDDGNATTTVGHSGTATHTYNALGDRIVSVQAFDKDGGISEKIEFKVTVVPPPPPPTVRIIPPAFEQTETDDTYVDTILVQLTEGFTSPVVVDLAQSIPDVLDLSETQVTFSNGETNKVVFISPKDGTLATRAPGVFITPNVVGTAAAVDHFETEEGAYVRTANRAPVITTPTASDLNSPNPVYTVPQGAPFRFNWVIDDVEADLPSMQVTWIWGDGQETVVTGGSGFLNHTYNALGDIIVQVSARDKDGGRSLVSFKIRVLPSKAVNAIPIGPNMENSYFGASGIGNGTVESDGARSTENRNNIWRFKYDPNITAAQLEAIAYKAQPSYTVTLYDGAGTPYDGPTYIHDSFFYVWVGADQGFPEEMLEPAKTKTITEVSLPDTQDDDEGGGTSSTSTRNVSAIFSREWLVSDNMGDINLDGIPDKIAQSYGLPEAVAAVTANPGDLPPGLLNARGYNGDEDYLPDVADGGRNIFATMGAPFTAFLEVRGFHEGLNRPGVSDPYGPLDEPGADGSRGGTDPTDPDTDGDGFPDGWEYYFWYNAKFQGLTGEKYNPANVAVGIEIDSKDIYGAFDPLTSAVDEDAGSVALRDLDNDGIYDIEELIAGTNPIHWDTDGDGMCDGWEILRGLDPTDARDGLNASMNNPDGDYMAYAMVPRQMLTVIGNNATNSYIGEGFAIGDTNGTLNAWYHYGDDDAPIAVGKEIEFPAGGAVTEIEDIQALLLHFQVRDAFGFDPRTAWCDEIDNGRFAGTGVSGSAPNTKPFTSVDEYLLMKFMSELEVNGTGATIPPENTIWSSVSTDPRTPDTDAGPGGVDGLPDGWELYVATRPGTTDFLISPWNYRDFDDDLDPNTPSPGDGLSVQREFAGLYSSAQYADSALYTSVSGYTTVSITPSDVDQYWVNKFWPTDPWNHDTDGDSVSDSRERAFIYGNPVDSGGLFTAGGGLNPCSVDTDRDALPDGWELQFAGTPVADDGSTTVEPSLPGQPQAPVAMVITNGMDGTVSDYNEDWDNDGLLNYQEYWVQAVRSFRYDVSAEDAPMDITHDVTYFFEELTTPWDIAQYPFGTDNGRLWYMLPPWKTQYVSTDPTNADTDNDAMDDYYEMFHGLNPILGMGNQGDIIYLAYEKNISAYANSFYLAVNGLPMDFQKYPWLAGLPEADADSDGLINFEEMLLANSGAAPNYNTDPTALWMTDYRNPNSLTHRFYFNGGMFFWPGTDDVRGQLVMDYAAMFDFEINEGYDTDNDGVSDKAELVHSRNPLSDPRDHDDPLRRQAIYFSGTNSLARTIVNQSFDEWSFRSFTVELWARPEVNNRDQVILERSVPLAPSDVNDTTPYRDRKTFQIGIAADGRIYALIESSGSDAHDSHTGTQVVYGPPVDTDKWMHIAARMDGNEGNFSIIIDGQLYDSVETDIIPATGVVTVDNSASGGTIDYYVYSGAIAVGATDITPEYSVLLHEWENFGLFYQGYVDEVRIWDGARELNDIDADRMKRYMRSDIVNNRETVALEEYNGATRTFGSAYQLSPELLYHYSFDNIFGGDNPASVAQVPRGFNDPAATTNRPPAADSDALLFGLSPVTSTVYTDKQYLPVIENSVDHLPIFGGVDDSGTTLEVLISDRVIDSVFWSQSMAGTLPGTYRFPNDNNPYGITYDFRQDDPTESAFEFFGDMLPLGDAFAKSVPEMWDGQGPSAPWAETGADSDSDGLPDWWEMDKFGTLDAGWHDLYPDASGMTNGERYLRDIAYGATPDNPAGTDSLVHTSDIDGDGIPDWWEDMYSLDKLSATGIGGAMGDPDRDGLPNIAEYLISEVYQFRYLNPRLFRTDPAQVYSDYYQKEGQLTLGAMFTDHDYIEDLWEYLYDPYFVSSYIYDAHEDNDEDGWSNWAEARYSAVNKSVRPDASTSLLPMGDSQGEYPVPFINMKLSYSGFQSSEALVVQAYSDPTMDGVPDATFAYGLSVDGDVQPNQYNMGPWKDQDFRVYLSPGHIDPGSIELRFTDVFTGTTLNFGYDQDGVIYGTYSGGSSFKIGTIDYTSGEAIVDLGRFNEDTIIRDDSGTYVLAVAASVVRLNYNVNLVSSYPLNLTLSRADEGYVREGLNYFFAFMDIDGNGVWNAGEPCGLPESFATDIGWDRNEIRIELTDYRDGYLRLDLASGLRSEDIIFGSGDDDQGGDDDSGVGTSTRVRILRKIGTQSQVMLDRTLINRKSIHEGDFLANGDLTLDWEVGSVDPNVTTLMYDVYVGDHPVTLSNRLVTSFMVNYDAARQLAVSTKPVHGAYVYSSRPVFRWTMPDKYPAFALEIKKGSSSGPTVYLSGAQKAPARDVATGEYIWEAPIHAGNRLPSGHIFAVNTVYAWRVAPLDAKYSSAAPGSWSEWKVFRLDVNKPMQSSGYGMIDVSVKYFGPAVNNLANKVKVEAYNTRDFTGVAESQYTLTTAELATLVDDQSAGNVNAVLRGLTPSVHKGEYYVMVYIDSNNNNKRDVWESWGYANYYGKNVPINDKFVERDSIFADIFAGNIAPYVALPVTVEMNALIPKVTVMIEDCDTDQDWFPDAWEYQMNPGEDFLDDIAPSALWPTDTGNTEVNPTLTTGAWSAGIISLLTFGSNDSDGDGIDDATEMLIGTDATQSDPLEVYNNLLMGANPEDEISLSLQGLTVSQNGPQLTWNLDVQRSDSQLSQGMLSLLSASGDGTTTYRIQYTESLAAPEWVTVEEDSVKLDGSKTLINQVTSTYLKSERGFFRVVIGD